MPKDSCVTHVEGFHIQVRKDYVDLFEGDHCAAVVMAFFEYATNGVLAGIRYSDGSGSPWVMASMRGIREEIINLFSISYIQRRIDVFEENGILLVEDKQVKIRKYLLNVGLINSLLSERRTVSIPAYPGKFTEVDKIGDLRKFTEVNPVNLPTCPGKFTEVEGVYKEEELSKKENIEITSIASFENISNERLTSDVVKEIQYSDVDEIELSDEGRKSKTQTWTSKEQNNFWGLWKRFTSGKPHSTIRKRFQGWLDYKQPGEAMEALRGYGNSGMDKRKPDLKIEEFRARYGEWLKIEQERDTSVPFVKTTPTTVPGQTIDPSASWGPLRAIARWNELVPSNPCYWDWDRDDEKDLRKALADPMFEKRFEELCAKAEADPNKSRDFQWMVTSYGKKAGNWWRYLNQKEAPKFKSKESVEETNRKVMERFGIK